MLPIVDGPIVMINGVTIPSLIVVQNPLRDNLHRLVEIGMLEKVRKGRQIYFLVINDFLLQIFSQSV